MVSLNCTYLGLQLSSPVVVSSSGLTSNLKSIIQLDKLGAGAVVLKSLFEEQINAISANLVKENDYPEALDYIESYVKDNEIGKYIDLIKNSKKETKIPIIASINCASEGSWVEFVKEIEKAGADALELNIYIINTTSKYEANEIENNYLNIVKKVRNSTNLPIAIKISPYFSNILNIIEKLYINGANAVVLFNRFYEPNININTLELTESDIFSTEYAFKNLIRWIAFGASINSKLDIAASSGIFNYNSVIKTLLAGGSAAQLCTTLYKNGLDYITTINSQIEEWMSNKGFKTIDEFKGKFSAKNLPKGGIYEKAQFMKYFSNHSK